MAPAPASTASSNVARFVAQRAREAPDRLAVAALGRQGYERWTRRELEEHASRLARGLAALGLGPGDRACVFVRPGLLWTALVHGLFKLGAVPVLIDPGVGRAGVLGAIRRVAPRALIGVWQLHLARSLSRKDFGSVELAISVGPSGPFCDGALEDLLSGDGREFEALPRAARDTAAILFTSGSTGPAKGVVYEHGMFEAQVGLLRAAYPDLAGGVDLACFPLFALFGPALELASVFPPMDFSHPARCDPGLMARTIDAWGATSSFGSPAIWRRVVPWCEEHGARLQSLRTLMIAGAPVESELVRRAQALIAPGGAVFTPYGATESLPLAQEDGRLLATDLAARAQAGEGTCVGRPLPGVEIRLIRIEDGPILRWSEDLRAAPGEAGEICVRGSNVTREYAFDEPATAAAKIADGDTFWHRVGDLGRFDRDGRLWFLGRKAHRLETGSGPLFPVGIENAIRAAARLGRCALVGVGPRGAEMPILVVEADRRTLRSRRAEEARASEILRRASETAACRAIRGVLFHPSFPLDVRHQAKIDRTALKHWAEAEIL
jgi:acyl-CoA synthetase (AMP-forming)/AMP-acid ligase II